MNFGTCHCENVEFGTYDNVVSMRHPSGKIVCIDTCIATEIGWLWHQNINTLNSCCGHKKQLPSVIVHPDDYEKMDKLGYKYEFAMSGLREYYLKTQGGPVSEHKEIYTNVTVEWNKKTNLLEILDDDRNQLALLYVQEED